LMAMQIGVALTANYGFFTSLSMALLLFVLDDRQLGRGERSAPPAGRSVPLALVSVLVVALSVVQFVPFVAPLRGLASALAPVRSGLGTFRSINAYHLFARMTLVRREA